MATNEEIQNRVDALIKRLLKGQSVSVEDAAREFDVSPKTIQRDITNRIIKTHLHNDIYFDPSSKTWKARNLVPEKEILSDEEMLMIGVFKELITQYGPSFEKQAERFFDRYRCNVANSIYANVNCEDINGHIADMLTIEKAIEAKQAISINYKGEGSRIVYPLKIATFDGYWYIVALNKKDDRVKNFYFKYMLEIKPIDEYFDVTNESLEKIDNAVNAYFDYHKEPFEVQLEISGEIAHIIKRKKINPSQYIMKEYEDGSLEISLYITYPMEIIPFIQSWVPHIRIISPLSLYEKIDQNWQRYIENN